MMETIQNDIFSDPEEGKDDHKEAIMIIDDNAEIIAALTLVLKDYYIIISCLSFEEARAKLTSKIRVVMLDIKMANKDGIEAFQLLKQENETLRIIFHSAYPGSEEKAQQAKSMAHDGYLTKGEYTTVELLETIQKTLKE
ncbi:MAG: response regulator [bacterium]|nr:response regulator [bacterium]